MKKSMMMLSLGLIVSSYCFASPPTTQIECVEDVQVSEPQSTLSIAQSDDSKAAVILKDQQGASHFDGTFHLIKNSFFSKVFQYDLVNESGTKTQLQVSWYKQVGRGGCGRAGCPGGLTGIEASLNLSGKEITYTCHEELN